MPPTVGATNATPDGKRPVALVAIGYLLALLLPIIGVLVGLVVRSRPGRFTSAHGTAIIVSSILVLALGLTLAPFLIEEGFHAAFPGAYSARNDSPQHEAQIRREVETSPAMVKLRREEAAVYFT